MKHHLVYKTTQISTGRIYIGKHSTNKLEDGYKGSGTEIAPLLKETPDDFVREVLFDFPSAEEAFEKEAELVTPEFLEGKGTTVFNKVPGGNLSQTSIKSWSAWQPGETYPPIKYVPVEESYSRFIEITKLKKGAPKISIPGYTEYYGAPELNDLLEILKNKNPSAHSYVKKHISITRGTYFFLACQKAKTPKNNQYVFVALTDFETAKVHWKDSITNKLVLMVPVSKTIFRLYVNGTQDIGTAKTSETKDEIIARLIKEKEYLKVANDQRDVLIDTLRKKLKWHAKRTAKLIRVNDMICTLVKDGVNPEEALKVAKKHVDAEYAKINQKVPK